MIVCVQIKGRLCDEHNGFRLSLTRNCEFSSSQYLNGDEAQQRK